MQKGINMGLRLFLLLFFISSHAMDNPDAIQYGINSRFQSS